MSEVWNQAIVNSFCGDFSFTFPRHKDGKKNKI